MTYAVTFVGIVIFPGKLMGHLVDDVRNGSLFSYVEPEWAQVDVPGDSEQAAERHVSARMTLPVSTLVNLVMLIARGLTLKRRMRETILNLLETGQNSLKRPKPLFRFHFFKVEMPYEIYLNIRRRRVKIA